MKRLNGHGPSRPIAAAIRSSNDPVNVHLDPWPSLRP